MFVGSLQKNNAQLRCLGLVEDLLDVRLDIDEKEIVKELSQDRAGEKYTVLVPQVDDQDPEKAKANALAVIKEHPDVACMVGLFAGNGPACLEAVKEAGKEGEIKIVAFDDHPATIAGIEEGDIYGTILQAPYDYGFESVRLLLDYRRRASNELPVAGGGSVTLACEKLTKDNLAEYQAKRASKAVASSSKKDESPKKDEPPKEDELPKEDESPAKADEVETT